MSEIEQILQRWQESLCPSVSVAGMVSRNPTAHKWKATYRSLVLRETVFWRTYDLITQAHLLFQSKHILGSRILIRSALESTAMLIYLNQVTSQLLSGSTDFETFELKTRRLLLGSRDGTTNHDSMNILTVLEQCERKYKGLTKIYEVLSECAHPNYEGVCFGYSDVDRELHETHFSNKWEAMWADKHDSLVKIVCTVFEDEYNNVWATQFKKLEAWLVEHDAKLSTT